MHPGNVMAYTVTFQGGRTVAVQGGRTMALKGGRMVEVKSHARADKWEQTVTLGKPIVP